MFHRVSSSRLYDFFSVVFFVYLQNRPITSQHPCPWDGLSSSIMFVKWRHCKPVHDWSTDVMCFHRMSWLQLSSRLSSTTPFIVTTANLMTHAVVMPVHYLSDGVWCTCVSSTLDIPSPFATPTAIWQPQLFQMTVFLSWAISWTAYQPCLSLRPTLELFILRPYLRMKAEAKTSIMSAMLVSRIFCMKELAGKLFFCAGPVYIGKQWVARKTIISIFWSCCAILLSHEMSVHPHLISSYVRSIQRDWSKTPSSLAGRSLVHLRSAVGNTDKPTPGARHHRRWNFRPVWRKHLSRMFSRHQLSRQILGFVQSQGPEHFLRHGGTEHRGCGLALRLSSHWICPSASIARYSDSPFQVPSTRMSFRTCRFHSAIARRRARRPFIQPWRPSARYHEP